MSCNSLLYQNSQLRILQNQQFSSFISSPLLKFQLENCTVTRMALGIAKNILELNSSAALICFSIYTLIKTVWNHNNTGDKTRVQKVPTSTLLEKHLASCFEKAE